MIKEGNCILRIACTKGVSHMLCWFFCVDIYDILNWRYASRSDLNYNIKIGSNKLQISVFEEKEDELKIK
jgi:hypothetical protein